MEWCTVFWILFALLPTSLAFNVDTENHVVHSGPPSSKFGFTVKQFIDQESKWLVVGAPEAETAQPEVYRPGAVYKCRAQNPSDCSAIPFDTTGNNKEWNGYAFIQTENKTLQWLGATLSTSSENGAIVACAPRYVYFSRKGDKREPIGMCYVSAPDMDIQTYTPCKHYGYGYHRVGFCQAGFSAALSTDGAHFAMGAVGSFYWQGQVFGQSLDEKLHSHETNEAPPLSNSDDSYQGYSMAKGEFTGDTVSDYVTGAPKGDGLLGRVAVYDAEMKSLHNISGEQIGEYFGYSVTVGDFNGDGLDDIAIGAPFYTDFDSDSFETGRAYVYYQTKKHSFRSKRDVLIGSKTPLSRFGLSLSAVGDINNDGITDLVVGAPYDGETDQSADGAIYIFHGSEDGIITEISQVIHASQLDSRLQGFGFSVHGGLDFDGNVYPDLLVGAVDADKAVYLKTRPIIRISADLRVEPTFINLEQRNCELNDETSVACFSIVTCMSYSGLGAPNEITLSMEWLLDDFRNLTQRALFLGGSERETKQSKTMKIYQTNRCQTHVAYLKNGIRDKLTPIAVVLKYTLLESRVPRGQLKPILDQYISSTVTTLGHIKKECGDDNICIPDLTVFVSKSAFEYVMGSAEDIDMMIEVMNLGEDAFEAQLNIVLPSGVDFRNIKNIDSSLSQQCTSYKHDEGHNYILCDLGNPLSARDYVRFTLKTKPNEKLIDPTSDVLAFSLSVNSSNPEDDSTISNNYAVVQIPLAAKTVIKVTGVSKPEQVLYNSSLANYIYEHEEDLGPELVHLYEIRNLGPSDIEFLSVVIRWPSTLNDGQNHFLYLPEMPHVVQGKGSCMASMVNPKNVTVSESLPNSTHRALYDSGSKRRQKRDLESLRQRRLTGTHDDLIKEVDCSDRTLRDCAVIRCHIESMSNGDVALVQVRARVWMQTIIQMQKEFRALEASSHATAEVVDVPYLMKPDEHPVDTYKVTTFVAAIDSGPGYQRVEFWVIVLAIVGGCLLLFLLVILLWMCGFFRRKKAEDEPDLLHKAELKPKPKNGMYESIPTEDL